MAKVGAALQDLFSLLFRGLVRNRGLPSNRTDTKCVGGPLPAVAGHVVQAVAVWSERNSGRKADIAILAQIIPWKVSLPDVARRKGVCWMFVAPRVDWFPQATACGMLPLCFGWQAPADPSRVVRGVLPRDMDNRQVVQLRPRSSRSEWCCPMGAVYLSPPFGPNDTSRRNAAVDELVENVGRPKPLRFSHISGLADEPCKLRIGYGSRREAKALDLNRSRRPFAIKGKKGLSCPDVNTTAWDLLDIAWWRRRSGLDRSRAIRKRPCFRFVIKAAATHFLLAIGGGLD